MNCYKSDNEGTLIELGDLSEEDAIEFLRIHRDEEGKNELFIGANRTDKDFVEIGYSGKEEFVIHTDRMSKPDGFLKSLFSKPKLDVTVEGIEEAESVLRAYFTKPRNEFEIHLEKLKSQLSGGINSVRSAHSIDTP